VYLGGITGRIAACSTCSEELHYHNCVGASKTGSCQIPTSRATVYRLDKPHMASTLLKFCILTVLLVADLCLWLMAYGLCQG
jgi:hypothetical protein